MYHARATLSNDAYPVAWMRNAGSVKLRGHKQEHPDAILSSVNIPLVVYYNAWPVSDHIMHVHHLQKM